MKTTTITIVAAFLVVLAATSSTQAQVRMPMRTYIPLREELPNLSPFTTEGKTPQTAIEMLYFIINPSRVANSVRTGGDWIMRRLTANRSDTRWMYSGGKLVWAGRFVYRYHAESGFAVTHYTLQNPGAVSGAYWQLNYSTGWMWDQSLFSEWDTTGFSAEYADKRQRAADGTLYGDLEQRTTSTVITFKSVIPRLLPTEVLMQFAGTQWERERFVDASFPIFWNQEVVGLYPGGFSTAEIPCTPVVPKNNSIIIYLITPIGRLLSKASTQAATQLAFVR